jgi:excisionase family DNA binding protein
VHLAALGNTEKYMNKKLGGAIENDGAYTVDEFCHRYGIGRTAFYVELAAGHLRAKKRGSRTLVPRAEARRWFENLPSLAVPADESAD